MVGTWEPRGPVSKTFRKVLLMKSGNGSYSIKMASGFMLALIMSGILSGCGHLYVASLHIPEPAVVETVSPRIQALVGTWTTQTHGETWYWFKGEEEDGYLFLIIEDKDGGTGVFQSVFVKVAEEELVFLEPSVFLFPGQSLAFLDFAEDHPVVQPIFTIYRFERSGRQVILSELRPGWLKNIVKGETVGIRFVEVDNCVLITSGPEEFLSFLEGQPDLPAAFRKFRVLNYNGKLP
jgi:hypothetical protein